VEERVIRIALYRSVLCIRMIVRVRVGSRSSDVSCRCAVATGFLHVGHCCFATDVLSSC
jgi:hypothetical protein